MTDLATQMKPNATILTVSVTNYNYLCADKNRDALYSLSAS